MSWLDSVRGIAAVMVVLYHLWEQFRNVKPEDLQGINHVIDVVFYQTFDLGKIGVVLFFAVSGFVIPFSLFKYQRRHILSFAISRFFRLYPLYWLSLLLAIYVLQVRPGWINVLINATMFQKFIGVNDMSGVYWTLQIELIFYVVCCVLFKMGWLDNGRKLSQCCYLFLVGAYVMGFARYLMDIKLPVALPLALCVMFIGMMWRFAFDSAEALYRRNAVIHTFIFILSMVPISLLAYNKDYGFNEVWYKYTITYVVAVILFIILTTVLKLNNSYLVFLGKISYSLYLLHPVFAVYICQILLKLSLPVSPYLPILISLLLSILVSSITYRWIEKPAIVLGKRLINIIQNRV